MLRRIRPTYQRQLLLGLALIVLTALLVVSLMSYVEHQASRQARLEVTSDWSAQGEEGFAWAGAGLTWSQPEGDNFVRNGEPVPYTAKLTAPVIHTSGDQVEVPMRLDPRDLPYTQDWIGASVRPLKGAASGAATLTAVQNHRLRQPHPLAEGVHLPDQARVLSAAYRLNSQGGLIDTLMVGNQGLVLHDVQSNQPTLVNPFTREDLVEVKANSLGYFVRTAEGAVWTSTDGIHWENFYAEAQDPVVRLAATDQALMWVQASGRGKTVDARLKLHALDSAVLFVPAGTHALGQDFVAPTRQGGLVAVTGEGQITPFLKQGFEGQNLLDAQAYATVSYFLYQDGSVKRFREGGELETVTQPGLLDLKAKAPHSTEQSPKASVEGVEGAAGGTEPAKAGDGAKPTEPAKAGDDLTSPGSSEGQNRRSPQLYLLGGEQPAVLLPQGGFWIYQSETKSWQALQSPSGKGFDWFSFLPRAGVLTQDEAGQVVAYQLATALTLDPPDWVNRLHAGDRLVLQQALPAPEPPLYWRAKPEQGLSLQQNQGDGKARFLLTPAAPGQTVEMSQDLVISPQQWPERAVFALSIQGAKGHAAVPLTQPSQGPAGELTVTLQGPDGQQWQQQWTISPPSPEREPQTEPVLLKRWVSRAYDKNLSRQAKLTLRWQGEGALEIEAIRLVQDQPSLPGLQPDFEAFLNPLKPAVLRLEGVQMGSRGRAPFAWLNPTAPAYLRHRQQLLTAQGFPLASGLTLAERVGATPWLVLQPYMRPEEVEALLEWLAGAPSTPYGQIRQEQGHILPWTQTFNRIYLEATGIPGERLSDRDQAEAVEALFNQIKRSPSYPALKNRLVFVDGLAYTRQEQLTLADEHATQLEAGFGEGLAPEALHQALLTRLPRQMLPGEGSEGREILSAIPLVSEQGTLRDLATLVNLGLAGEGRLTHLVLYRLDGAPLNEETQTRLTALFELLKPRPGGTHRVTLNRRLEPGHEPALDQVARLGSFALKAPNGEIQVIFTNNSSVAQSLQWVSEGAGSMTYSERVFDRQGQVIRSRHIREMAWTIEVPPGGVVCLEAKQQTK